MRCNPYGGAFYDTDEYTNYEYDVGNRLIFWHQPSVRIIESKCFLAYII